ncbi:phenylalanine--tRNA ligase subunit alpha, partial [Pseudomonas sp. 2995-1]
MLDRLQELKDEALNKVKEASSLKELKEIRIAYLGKKGPIQEVMKGMGKLSKEERPKVGQVVNEVREAVTALIEEKE